ncbi:MAG: TonB-dependent receptor [Cellvibrionaceae bacterium]
MKLSNLKPIRACSVASFYLCTATHGFASGIAGTQLEEVTVMGRESNLQGRALSASVGTVTREQLEHRPLLRPAEVMETVPGLVVTQHSGDGKANQYFLRGFNLDHGTDFASYVDGMPVNMVTHGHGQGYTDLNFLIPELIDSLVYKKGPYYAEEGDFSSAGSGRIALSNQLDTNTLTATFGPDNYQRLLQTGQLELSRGRLLGAVELQRTDGPWDLEQDLKRDNLVLRYASDDNPERNIFGLENSRYSVTLMAYKAQWNATDQIPQRLIDSGELDRFGYVSDTSGGETHRYSLSFDTQGQWNQADVQARAYVIDYQLRLTSNTTYYVGDTVNGDEFTQLDERRIWGGDLSWTQPLEQLGELSLGTTLRYDDIVDVGVGPSQNGRNTSFTARDQLEELAFAGYASLITPWNDWFTSSLGIRYDRISVDVKHRGDDSDQLLSPKMGLQFGPWLDTEFFVNYGHGFHSNDARGVVADTEAVPLFAKSKGTEIGFRTAPMDNLQLSFALFHLDLDSELIFVGDDGTTEPREATHREGWELGLYYQPTSWLIVDADITEAKAEFKDKVGGKTLRVPDAVERVMSLGVTVNADNGWHGGLRWRYLGARALTEDNSVRSDSTSMLNLNVGYRVTQRLSLGVEAINLLDTEASDITYLYESRTQQELQAGDAPVLDKHLHPVEPRTLRATVSYQF